MNPEGDVSLPPRLERAKSALACPACGGDLDFGSTEAGCTGCSKRYAIRNGKIYFVPVPDRRDELDSLKGALKRMLGRRYYSVGVHVFAPTYPFNYARRVRRHLDPARHIVVDAGCGNNRFDEDVIGLDVFDYPEVDLVCDLKALPFRVESVDAFVSRSVLEHVPDPWGVVREFHRCTRAGGFGVHALPFLFPFHASPGDFYRFTDRGARELFAGWRVVEQENLTGPVTLALLVGIEFASSLLAGPRPRLKAWLYLALCGVLFPLKYLDFPFVGRKRFASLAPTLVTVVRKP